MMIKINNIDLAGCVWYKMRRHILPFKLDHKWYLWRKIRITYLIEKDGSSKPIKYELVKNINYDEKL